MKKCKRPRKMWKIAPWDRIIPNKKRYDRKRDKKDREREGE